MEKLIKEIKTRCMCCGKISKIELDITTDAKGIYWIPNMCDCKREQIQKYFQEQKVMVENLSGTILRVSQ